MRSSWFPADEGAALAAFFADQPNIREYHLPVNRLAHVVNGERGDADGRHGLHLYASSADRFDLRLDYDLARCGIARKEDLDPGEFQRMAQGYEAAGLLRRHDPCDSGRGEYIPFRDPPLLDQRGGPRTHPDLPPGNRPAEGGRLGRHIHHARLTFFIEMG